MVHGDSHNSDSAIDELRQDWSTLADDDKKQHFTSLSLSLAEELFTALSSSEQAELLSILPREQRRLWLRCLPPDDAADVIQHSDGHERVELLQLLDEQSVREINALLAYREDEAGGLMNPRFARVRPDITAHEAIAYLRRQPRNVLDSMDYVYVLDAEQKLLGITSLRALFAAEPLAAVSTFMESDFFVALENMEQGKLSKLFKEQKLIAVPVVDDDMKMKGIITADDIVDAVTEQATEEMQKVGGSSVLSGPYLSVGILEMVKKRAGWLALLFLGEMLTASTMASYENKLQHAVVLALFLPLIISSGGNSGSQTSTLIIRALALGELQSSDWWRVLRRELIAGLVLGVILGIIGFMRVELWSILFGSYANIAFELAMTIGVSLIGVVVAGTMAGSMLPFLLRRVGFDPASASAPFVATLIDVTGLIIYFSVATMMLKESLTGI